MKFMTSCETQEYGTQTVKLAISAIIYCIIIITENILGVLIG